MIKNKTIVLKGTIIYNKDENALYINEYDADTLLLRDNVEVDENFTSPKLYSFNINHWVESLANEFSTEVLEIRVIRNMELLKILNPIFIHEYWRNPDNREIKTIRTRDMYTNNVFNKVLFGETLEEDKEIPIYAEITMYDMESVLKEEDKNE